MSEQLQITSRPGESVTSLSVRDASREPLTFPTTKAIASQFAIGWRRKGFDVELAKRGRLWCVVEVEE